MKQLVLVALYGTLFYPLAACAAICAIPAMLFGILAYLVDFAAHTLDEVWK